MQFLTVLVLVLYFHGKQQRSQFIRTLRIGKRFEIENGSLNGVHLLFDDTDDFSVVWIGTLWTSICKTWENDFD